MSWGLETPKAYSRERLTAILESIDNGEYGDVLRAKGMLPDTDGGWLYFDCVPGDIQIRGGSPDVTGKVCVIGAELKEDELDSLFQVTK